MSKHISYFQESAAA